jgi:hypothetical protein
MMGYQQQLQRTLPALVLRCAFENGVQPPQSIEQRIKQAVQPLAENMYGVHCIDRIMACSQPSTH